MPTSPSSELVFERIYQPRCDAFQGEYVYRGAEARGGLGHAVDRARGLVLGNGVVAFVAQGLQTFRAVPAHARQQDTHRLTRPVRADAGEEDIHGWPVGLLARLRPIPDALGGYECQMVVGAGEQHRAWGRAIAFLRHAYRQARIAAQPFRHPLSESLVHVLNDHYRGREVLR